MKPQLYTLPNGLRVVLEENHASPVISLQTLVQVGSADETDKEAGICHLIEHMLFKGTAKRKVGEIAQDVEAAGGDVNAYTSFDQTVYYINMASRFLDQGLDILADAVQNPAFDATELEREKEVILEEIRRERDNPAHYIGEILFQKAFNQHTYGRPIIGFDHTVKATTQNNIFDFFHRWYIPENTVFVAVGDFKTEIFLKQIGEAFKHFKNPNPDRLAMLRKTEPIQTGPRVAILPDNIQSVHFSLSFHVPAITHTDIPALDILSHILGGASSSRLEQRLKEKKRLVQSIHAYTYAPKDPGLFLIGGHLNAPQGLKAFQGISEEIERFKIEGPTPKEMEHAKRNIRASETYEKETVGGQAGKIAYYLATAGDLEFEEKYFQKIQSVTPEMVAQACQQYLKSQNLTAALLAPEKDLSKIWKEKIERALTEAPSVKLTARQRLVKKKKEEKPLLLRLPGGAKLVLQENRSLPIVACCIAAKGGVLAETPATNGIHSLMAQCLTKGTQKLSALEVAQAIESMAGSLEGFSGKNSYGLRGEFLSDNLEQGLELFFDVLLNPAWNKTEVAKEKKLTLEMIKNQEDNLAQLAFYHFQKTLFPNHPYGMRTIGSKESIVKFFESDLKREHRKILSGKNVVMSLVGDFDQNTIQKMVKTQLARLSKSTPIFQKLKPSPKPKGILEARLSKKAKEQAHIVLGFQANSLLSPDHYPMTVLNHLLSGMGGRLFMELRDKKSLAYSVTSVLSEGLDPGYFAVYIGTDPSKISEAIDGIKAELKKITTALVTPEEMERTQNYLVGTYELSLQKRGGLSQSLAFNELYGLGLEEIKKYPEKILKVEREDILRVAKHYMNLDAYVISVVEPV